MSQTKASSKLLKPSYFDVFLILLTSLIWGSAFIGIKIAVEDFSPMMVAFSRVSIAYLFLYAYLIYSILRNRQHAWPTGLRNWIIIACIALLYTALPFTFIAYGQQFITASLTSLLMGISPLTGYIIAHFLTHDEKLNRYKIASLLLGMLGIYIAIGIDQSDPHPNLWIGIGAIMCGTIFYNISGILTRKVTDGSTENISLSVLGIGSLYLLPLIFITDQVPHDFSQISNESIYALIYLGLFPTGLAYLVRFYLIRKIGFTAFLATIFFIPIFGVILSNLILGESLSIYLFIGLALILGSLAITKIFSNND